MSSAVRVGTIVLLILPWISGSQTVRAQEKSRIAVLDLRDKGVGADVASLLTGVVSNRLAELGVFEVVSREDIKNMLSHEQDKILLGCDQVSCLAEIGGALGAENLLAGDVGLVGKTYVIGLQLIDIRNAKVTKRVERQFEGVRERLLGEVSGAAAEVVEDILKSQSGFLLVTVSEEGADIALGGKTIGVSPLPKVEVPAGPRDIRVSKEGFVHWARTVQVLPREVQMVEINLIPSGAFIEAYESRSDLMRTFAWITLAGFLACEAAAVGLRTYTFLNYDSIEDDYNSGNYRGMTQREFYDLYKPDMDRAEILDTIALGAGITGVVAGAFSLYLFLAGDDPDRYERFRGVQTPAVPPAAAGVTLAPGGMTTLRLRF